MGDLRAAVDEVVSAMGDALERSDAGLIALAQALADSIDERSRIARYAAAAIAAYEDDPDEHPVEVGEALGALRAKLSERETLDRLGARLHAALVDLGATPRARVRGEAPKGKPRASGSALELLRGGAS